MVVGTFVEFGSCITNIANLIFGQQFGLHNLGHCHKALRDPCVIFGAGLIEWDSYFGCQFLALLEGYFSLGIAFVAHQYDHHIRSRIGFYLFQPVCDPIEGSNIIDSVCEEDSHRPPEISLRNSFKSLLACSVPYLHPDLFPIHINCLCFEIDPFIIC